MQKPFEALEAAENILEEYLSSDLAPTVLSLQALLVQERVLDNLRPSMFEEYGHGSDQAKDYGFREYMFRHNISKFALSLDKSETDKITGEDMTERSFVAICAKNRELYPEPK